MYFTDLHWVQEDEERRKDAPLLILIACALIDPWQACTRTAGVHINFFRIILAASYTFPPVTPERESHLSNVARLNCAEI